MNNPKDKINISDQILKKIKTDDVKMRSKWFFVAERLGLESGLLLSLLIGVAILCLMIYIMEENGAFEFTEFGPSGWPVIWDNIPLDLVIAAVVFFIIANYIIKQFDFSYKKPFYIFSCSALVVIASFGLFLTYTGVSHAIFDKIAQTGFAKNLMQQRITKAPMGEKALVGKIVKVSSDRIYVSMPGGKVAEVKFAPKIQRPLDIKYGLGQMVKIIGQKNGQTFGAKVIRIVVPNQSRYFRSMPIPTATNSN